LVSEIKSWSDSSWLQRPDQETWNIFTRREELNPKRLDRFSRFTYSLSRHKDILEPRVSKFLVENGLRAEYPENKNFAVTLTHDVDDIYLPFTHKALSSVYLLKGLNFKEIINLWKMKEKSQYIHFEEIMNLEEEYEAKSTFYFMATDRDPVRFRYDIEDLEGQLKKIVDRDFEIGLHIGYYSYDNLEEIKKEKKRLENVIGEEITGCRIHYLRFKVPDTWELLAMAGFRYDTTLGYNDMVGFRNGMCHPFKPFNLKIHKDIDILEIPLNIMDGTLFGEMRLNLSEAWNLTKKLINTTEKYNGVLTLLFHSMVFNCPFRRDWARLYNKILKYCHERKAWMTSAKDLWRWWEDGY